MIRAIFFDFGHVLVRPVAPDETIIQWESTLGLTWPQLGKLLYGGEMGQRANLGDISDDDLWEWAGRRLDLQPHDLVSLRMTFTRSYALDDDLLNQVKSLREKYEVAIISNAPSSLREHIDDYFGISDFFSLIVCSAEERVAKPDHEIYRRALSRLQCLPGESVLIDDRQENVVSAQILGMHGIVFNPDTNLAVELAKLGVDAQAP